MRQPRARAFAAVGVVAAGVALGWAWTSHRPAAAPLPASAAAGPRPGSAPVDLFDRVAASGARDGERSIAAIEEALYVHGSLRGSTPDGGWALDGQGRLLPDIGVRRRFDQLLTTLGEATADELGRLLRAQAGRELKPAGVEQLMQLWQAYIGLQRQVYRHEADPTRPTTWQAALDERVQARRAALGVAWADAFYGDEEARMRAQIAARLDRSSTATAPVLAALPDAARMPGPNDDVAGLQRRRVAEFGAEAAQRLADEDAAQRRWNERLAEAKQRIAALQDATELSASQRAEAIERYLAGEFDPGEQVRVRGLLKL